MNSIYSAMRKLFREVLELPWSMKKLPRSKKETILPEIVSKNELKRLITSCRLLKHLAILITLYATGMRPGELCALKLEHIDGERLQIKIRKGKGAKDRYIHVPLELIEYLRLYYQKYRPHVFLFNGREKGSPMCVNQYRANEGLPPLKYKNLDTAHSVMDPSIEYLNFEPIHPL